MGNLIERYVYDVTRRLPEKEREEVRRDLTANIYDMLPENAEESDIEAVLYRLDSPTALAEKYRQQPRYLISPAIYDDYIRLLKWVLPLVGFVVLLIGLVLGGIEAMQDGSFFIKTMLSKGMSMGAEAAIQTFLWITIVFIIIERTNAKQGAAKPWKISDLPNTLPADKSIIPLADSIAELVLTLVFCVFALLLSSGIIPFRFIVENSNTQVYRFFNPSFLAVCLPVFALIGLLGGGVAVIKIRCRRWTPTVCWAVLVDSLLSMAAMVYLINRPDMLSSELAAFMQDISPSLFSIGGKSSVPMLITLLSVIIVVTALGECGRAIYRTYARR